jgi:hypothetical protein
MTQSTHRSTLTSLHRSTHESTGVARSEEGVDTSGRSLHRDRLIYLTQPETSTQPLTIDQLRHLVRALTARDVAILTALHQYRYLDSVQLEQLFFQGQRRCLLRLKHLRDLELIQRWQAIQPPGWRRRSSVILLSTRGAGALAACLGMPRRACVDRARHAQEHCLHISHDLESNELFVAAAVASRARPDEGLYHWVGEESCRQIYGQRGARITPDGWGRYLTAAGEVAFFLEWDRATESLERIRQKATGYRRHFSGQSNAGLNHVLFVAPAQAREAAIAFALEEDLVQGGPSFWTSNLEALESEGVLGSSWQRAGASPSSRVALSELPTGPRSTRRVEECIGKPEWWERRRGGGEGA